MDSVTIVNVFSLTSDPLKVAPENLLGWTKLILIGSQHYHTTMNEKSVSYLFENGW